MPDRHKVATVDEVPSDGSRVISEVNGNEVAIFRIDGEYRALANFCPHQSGPLCEGELTGQMVMSDDNWNWEYEGEGEYIACPWHEWKFDTKTGENLQSDRYRVPSYNVEVDGDDIYVVR